MITNLNKFFGKKQILKDINYQFETGITALVGPNGSGKSTLLQCILGIYNFKGSVILPSKSVAWVPDIDNLDYNITGREYLSLKSNNSSQLDFYTELFDIEEYLGLLLPSFSHGNLKKICLIGALIQSPKILILDEPFNGLDPEYSIILQDILLQLKTLGIIILLSSHNLEIVQKITDNLIFLKNGEIILQGKTSDIDLANQFLQISGIKKNYDLTQVYKI